MKFLTKVSFLLIAALVAAPVSAMVVAMDDFSYADGALVPNGGWANQSGTAGTLLVASGEAVVTQDGGSEDAELVVGSDFSTGVITADFDIRVTAPGAMTGTDFEYFAHFSDDTAFNFRSRLDVVAPGAGGDYTLGIATSASTAEATLPVDFSFGATVPVSLSFDIDAGLGSVTAGGSTVSSTTVDMGEVLDAFNLRQSSSSSDETIFVDNLVVSYVPEPAAGAALLMLSLSGLAIRRRRED